MSASSGEGRGPYLQHSHQLLSYQLLSHQLMSRQLLPPSMKLELHTVQTS